MTKRSLVLSIPLCWLLLAQPLAAVRRDGKINLQSDDGEETPAGAVVLNNNGLRLGLGLIGLRFSNVRIPPGVAVTRAVLEFQTRELDTVATRVVFRAEAADSAAPFAATPFNFSSRPKTAASVTWDVPPWTTLGERHQSPNLAAVVNEVVRRPGWVSGNSLAFFITPVLGRRIGQGFRATPRDAAILRLEWSGQEEIPGTVRCYAVADGSDHFLVLDSATGTTVSDVGDTTVLNIEAIALDPLDFELYAADEVRPGLGQLGRLDIRTGQFVRLPQIIGSGNGVDGVVALGDVDGLAFDPRTRLLWGTVRREIINQPASPPDLLIQIDPDTGARIADAFGPGVDYVPITGPGVEVNVDDIGLDPMTGTLYGSTTAIPEGVRSKLITIDPATGAATGVGDFSVAGDNMEGLGFRFDGVLYGTQGRRLFTVNRSTGKATQVGTGNTITGGDDVEAFACHFTALTRAVVAHLGAFRDGDATFVEWETASEEGTLGYHLFRQDPVSGRYVQVNRELEPALAGAPQGGRYRLRDLSAPPDATTLRYVVVEVETSGVGRWHHPREVVVEPRSPLAALRSPRQPPAAALADVENSIWDSVASEVHLPDVKVLVSEPGLYFIAAADLVDVFGDVAPGGVSLALRRGLLALSHRGEEVAWLAAPDGSGLYFWADPLPDLYSAEAIYRLSRRPGRSWTRQAGAAASPALEQSFPTTVHAEEDVFAGLAAAPDPQGDFWFWKGLSAGHPTEHTKTLTFDITGVAPDVSTARLALELYGVATTGLAGEHHTRVTLNGLVLGEVTWAGRGLFTATFELPQSWLAEGPNELVVQALLPPGVPWSLYYVDSVEVDYARTYRSADGASLAFTGGGHPQVTVTGFDRPELALLDVSDPLRPELVGDLFGAASGEDGAGGYRLDLVPSAMATYVALTPDAVKTPALRPWTTAQPALTAASRRGEYLVLAPPALLAAAHELAAYRASRGLTTAVVDVEAIYNELHHGYPSPQAIHDFLTLAYAGWQLPPRYVVLVGRGTYDYRDLLGQGDNLLPPLLVRGVHGLFASDAALVDVRGDDGLPDLAVGRLPVRSPAELVAYVEKLAAYESTGGGWRRRAVLTADRPDVGGAFVASSRQLQAILAESHASEEISLADLGLDEARSRLLAAWNAGAGLLSFVGHGSPFAWTPEGFLTTVDAAALTNGPRLPLVLALTCQVNRFDLPGLPALGEVLTLAPQGGAVAVWGSAGLSLHAESQRLGENFLRVVTEGNRLVLGDAILEAIHGLASPIPAFELLQTQTLVGDPALEWKPGS